MSAQADHLLIENCGTAVTGPFTLTIDKSAQDYSNLFTASSASGWKVGDIRSTGLDGWVKIKHSSEPTLRPGDQLYVAYIATSQGSAGSSYVIPKNGLQHGEWLRFDGSVSSQPCP